MLANVSKRQITLVNLHPLPGCSFATPNAAMSLVAQLASLQEQWLTVASLAERQELFPTALRQPSMATVLWECFIGAPVCRPNSSIFLCPHRQCPTNDCQTPQGWQAKLPMGCMVTMVVTLAPCAVAAKASLCDDLLVLRRKLGRF